MSKRKQLVEKIIREELVGYAKKILDEGKGTGMHRNGSEAGFTQGMGLRGGDATMPAPEPNRAVEGGESAMGGRLDRPGLTQYYVEEKISDRLEEEASESDNEDYGVNTTSAAPAGGDETGKIEHVPGYPLPADANTQNESVFRRWKKIASIKEGVDDAEFEAEELAPPVYVNPDTGMEDTPPTTGAGMAPVPDPDTGVDTPAGPPGMGDMPTPDTAGRLDALTGDMGTAIAGAETDMGNIPAPGGGNLMDMSKDLFGDEFKPAGDMFDMGELGAPPMDMSAIGDPAQVEASIEGQIDQDFEMPEADETLKEAIRRVLKEKLLT